MFAWWAASGGGGVAGIAFVGVLCSPYHTSLNEKQSTAAGSGFVSCKIFGVAALDCLKLYDLNNRF